MSNFYVEELKTFDKKCNDLRLEPMSDFCSSDN
jgi:hypothetical protein